MHILKKGVFVGFGAVIAIGGSTLIYYNEWIVVVVFLILVTASAVVGFGSGARKNAIVQFLKDILFGW